MRLLGFEITRRKPPVVTKALAQSVQDRGWWSMIYDAWPGGWQANASDAIYSQDTVLAYHAVYACITLIANDIGKLRHKLVEQDPKTRIWSETTNSAFSPVLRRPNNYQNHIQFKEWWITSKLINGNAYALKQRDGRGVVTALYLLDPLRVKPLVTPTAEVYYELKSDNMAGLEAENVVVPASEIIHDRMNCLFHPLLGVGPIFACGAAASQGLRIIEDQNSFFANHAHPGGMLLAPGAISQDTAERLKTYWNENFAGDNAGKIAALGDGLKYEPMRMTAADAQLIDQLKWTAEIVCSAFHVPPFKIGLGIMPTYQNAEVLNQIYYADCLQSLIEQFEACMDEGIGLDTPTAGRQMGVELDLSGLLRMDQATQIKTLTEGVKGGLWTPNEARSQVDAAPLAGGDTVYLQQQYYSLEALAERDANAPFATPPPPAVPAPDKSAEPETDDDEDDVQRFAADLIAYVLQPASATP